MIMFFWYIILINGKILFYISKCKRFRYRWKKKKIDLWFFDRKINVVFLYKYILIENMNVNIILVEKGKCFMYIGI